MGSRAKEGEERADILVEQKQTEVNKFIIPDFGFEFQWQPGIDWQIDR